MTHKSHSLKEYYIVYILLMALLIATIGVAYVHLGALNTPVAMLIATVKACMVLWIFMHVREAPKLVIPFIASALIMLAVCFVVTMADYLTRW